ncbi:MAG: FtsH protease activity modulator HflK [Pseudomonadota bacterium]|nr:FtsH protease activity modulator HflK [Pseudomonadota bacterium]
MAWNEPGKPGQDPWGNSGNNGNNGGDNEPPKQQPPRRPKKSDQDLDAMLKKAQSIFGGAGNKMGNGGGIGGLGGSLIFGVIVVVWLLSGIYIVDPAERGVVTRFGAFVEETKAGPHWHMPYPIETVRIVNVDQIRTAEIGYRSGTDSRNNRSGDVPNESLMLTKDENIVDLKIAIQYKIESANQYLFQTADPDLTLRAVTESALREVVGQNSMDFVLTEGRNEVVSKVQELAQVNLNAYGTGLMITTVNLQDAQPPEQVQSAFADVVKAREDRERLINEAEAYSNDVLPKARGKAARELEEASAYHDRVIAQATGEASRFTSIVTEYQKAPEVTRNRLYIDAVTNVLGNTSKVFIGSDNANNLMYLPLDKMVGGQSSTQFKMSENAIAPQPVQPAPAATNNNTSQRTGIRDYLKNRELR